MGVVPTAYATRRSDPGPVRVLATSLSLFFGVGRIVGHSTLPAPALLSLLSCPLVNGTSIYGDAHTAALLTVVPGLIQGLIVLAVSYLCGIVCMRLRRRRPGSDRE